MSSKHHVNPWSAKMQFIEYHGHPGLSEFSTAYIQLLKTVDQQIAAIESCKSKRKNEISWDAIARECPNWLDLNSAEATALINLRADREVESARAQVILTASRYELLEAIAFMSNGPLKRLSRQFPDSDRAKELNARYDPYQKNRGSQFRYFASGLAKGGTVKDYARIEKETGWNLQAHEMEIAANNFVCGVLLLKRAQRVYSVYTPGGSRSLFGMIHANLLDAQTFYQTLAPMRADFTQAEVDADFVSQME